MKIYLNTGDLIIFHHLFFGSLLTLAKKKKDCTFHVTHHSCSAVFPKGHAILCRMDFNILSPLDHFIPVDT